MSAEYPTSRTLLLRLRDHGDQVSWTEFVEIYGPLIRRFALSRGVSVSDCEDVSQEVLRSIASAIRSFEYDAAKGTFKGWLFTAVRREVARIQLKARRQPAIAARDDPSEKLDSIPTIDETTAWEKDYQRQLMHWAIEKIKPEFSDTTWQAFHLSALEGVPTNEVGSRLGASPGSIYVSRSRVLKRLREKVTSIASDVWELEMARDKAE